MKSLKTALIAFAAGLAGAFTYMELAVDQEILATADTTDVAFTANNAIIEDNEPYRVPSTSKSNNARPLDYNEDFVLASEKSTASVVFIQTLSETEYRRGSWMDWFFEPRSTQKISNGSGVIVSKDGYIVTNNHVIQDADDINVIVGKETFPAELIGTDPSTDLALIKVNGAQLPAIALGNSSDVKVGEWVIAVGNPFNLTSTVTAGIVSAKGRNINILRDKFPLESFIQTDAAINPGNSGGALVNTKGELIGINTAILSRTGSYAGYGFAVPVDIVKKVFNDLKTYGEVQKAFMGAEYLDVDTDIKERMELNNVEGVIIIDVRDGWAADKGGLKKGDVILKANDMEVENKAMLEETLGYLYPGDKLSLVIRRDGKVIEKVVTLMNREGTTDVIRKSTYYSQSLGVSFESVPKLEREVLGIENGIRVVKIENGFFNRLDIPEGFIITRINNAYIESPEEVAEILERIKGRVIISGVDKRGRKVYYPYVF